MPSVCMFSFLFLFLFSFLSSFFLLSSSLFPSLFSHWIWSLFLILIVEEGTLDLFDMIVVLVRFNGFDYLSMSFDVLIKIMLSVISK